MTTRHEGWEFDEKVLPNAQLYQGDLIAFETHDPLRRYGLIVTADCDLENKKHGRLITLVPVVELIDLVEHYLLLEHCDRLKDPLTAWVSRTFQMSTELLLPENVAELRLKVEEKSTDPQWRTACLGAKLVLQEVDRLKVSEFKTVMQQAGISIGNMNEKLDSQIRSKGDILRLPSLSNVGIAADIAWVRHVWQLPLRNVVFRTSEVNASTGQKVARLDSPFRYRLTQLMAQVFSDIGLPKILHDHSSRLSTMWSK